MTMDVNSDHGRYDLLRRQCREAIDLYEASGLPAGDGIAEMVKLLTAISLTTNGPADTIIGLRSMIAQIEDALPKASALADAVANFPPAVGNA
jgi:hypothetical protein